MKKLTAAPLNSALKRLLTDYFETKQPLQVFDKVSVTEDELRWIVSKIQLDAKVVGCGGWGLNTITNLTEAGIYGAVKCVCDTDAIDLFRAKADKKILVGEEITKGAGTDASVEFAEKALEASKKDITDFLKNSKFVVVAACYGGGAGTVLSQFVATTAKKAGALVIGIAAIPHSSGITAELQAISKNVEQFVGNCDITLMMPVEKILRLLPEIERSDAYNVTTNIASETILHLLEIVATTTPSFMRIDYFDFQTLLKDSGLAFSALGESTSPTERVRYAVEDALKSPFITSKILSTANGLILNIVSDPGVSDVEITDAVSFISTYTNPSTKTLVSFSYNPALEETAKAFILLTGVRTGR